MFSPIKWHLTWLLTPIVAGGKYYSGAVYIYSKVHLYNFLKTVESYYIPPTTLARQWQQSSVMSLVGKRYYEGYTLLLMYSWFSTSQLLLYDFNLTTFYHNMISIHGFIYLFSLLIDGGTIYSCIVYENKSNYRLYGPSITLCIPIIILTSI